MKYVKLASAQWCSQCPAVKKALQELEEQGVAFTEYIDVDEDTDFVKEYGIRGLPTIIDESGRKLVGSKTKAQIMEWLDGE